MLPFVPNAVTTEKFIRPRDSLPIEKFFSNLKADVPICSCAAPLLCMSNMMGNVIGPGTW
jgi:hypothetical protein